jgi:peptidoglycan/LPS O-acetylase OafA/YrhL
MRDEKPQLIPALDGFRAYAILVVVALHLILFAGVLDGRAGTGFATVIWGVAGNVIDVFFILSGFLLFLPMVRRGGVGSLREYAVGRAVRLFPAYWLALAISAGVAIGLDNLPAPSVEDLAIHAAALQAPARLLDANLAVGFGVNGALWMVSVIVAFYIVLPLVARPYLRHPLLGLATAAAITVAWKLGIAEFDGALSGIEGGAEGWLMQLIAIDQLPGWAFSFALGMTGAWAWVRWREPWPERRLGGSGLALLAVAVAAFAACAYAYGHQAATINSGAAGPYARGDELLGLAYSSSRALLLTAILIGPLWLQRPFAARGPRKLGQLSYGLYLIHLPVATVVGVLVLELPTDGSLEAAALWLAVVISVSLVYAELTRRWMERPLVDAVMRRRRAAAAPIESPPRAREEPGNPRGEARLPA